MSLTETKKYSSVQLRFSSAIFLFLAAATAGVQIVFRKCERKMLMHLD
jgi:hypothetical protein